jgi:hypothetical protein
MYVLLSGAIGALAIVAAAFFLRSYARNRDRFFAVFAAAFTILGASQLGLGILDVPESDHPFAYLARLGSFLLILFAIVDKNISIQKHRSEEHKVGDLAAARRKIAR